MGKFIDPLILITLSIMFLSQVVTTMTRYKINEPMAVLLSAMSEFFPLHTNMSLWRVLAIIRSPIYALSPVLERS